MLSGSGSSRRILEEVMPIRIIREVEKWPVIYKKDNVEMNNPHFKHKIWEEVAKNLFDNYELCTTIDKHLKVDALMKKWRNLRDTFKRQLVVEKRNRAGHNIKKREYVYFKHMAFLLPHMADDEQASPPPAPSPTGRGREHKRRKHAEPSLPEPGLALEQIDEDKHFLLSLLPSFHRMTEDEKLTVKMEILKVIKDIKNNSTALDTLALATDDDELVVVKQELITIDGKDYRANSASGDSE